MNNKKVILMSKFYLPNIGGVENSIYKISNSLNKSRYDVEIITTDTNNFSSERLLRDEVVNEVRIKRVKQFKNRIVSELYYHIKTLELISKQKNKSNIVVIARNHYNVLHARLLGVENVSYLVPGVIKYQNNKKNLSSSLKARLSVLITSYFQKLAIKYSSNVFVFSNNMKKQVCDIYHRDDIKITKPGVDKNIYCVCNDVEIDNLKSKLGLPKNKKIILGLGRFVKAKGFLDIINVMPELSDDYVFVLVGDGPEKEIYEKTLSNKKINNVLIKSATRNPEWYYKISDVFMMSSVYEPLGQTILEAQACGLPILYYGSDENVINACDEIVHNSLSMKMKYGDNESILNGIINLNCCYKEKKLLHEFAVENFNWDKLTNELICDYE